MVQRSYYGLQTGTEIVVRIDLGWLQKDVSITEDLHKILRRGCQKFRDEDLERFGCEAENGSPR